MTLKQWRLITQAMPWQLVEDFKKYEGFEEGWIDSKTYFASIPTLSERLKDLESIPKGLNLRFGIKLTKSKDDEWSYEFLIYE